ncbi:MAG: hypothetical protein PHO53_01495 [Actinomycetota bacterium]|nr:hypothetical protein [Actinomycetota bacterium]
MCGIIGYVGNLEAKAVLYQGLRRLEYRGYDSAGICVVSPEGKLECVKAAGNLDALGKALDSASLESSCGANPVVVPNMGVMGEELRERE